MFLLERGNKVTDKERIAELERKIQVLATGFYSLGKMITTMLEHNIKNSQELTSALNKSFAQADIPIRLEGVLNLEQPPDFEDTFKELFG